MGVQETGDRQRNHHHQVAIDRNPYQSEASQPQKKSKIMHKKQAPTPGSRNRSKRWAIQNIKILLNF